MEWKEERIIDAFAKAFAKEFKGSGYKTCLEDRFSISGWDFRPDMVIRDTKDNVVGVVEVKSHKASTRDVIDMYEMAQAVSADKKIIAAPGGTADAMEMAEDLGVKLLLGDQRQISRQLNKISKQLKEELSF